MDIANSEGKTRRDFLNSIIGIGLFGWLLTIIYPLLKYIVPPKMREPEVKTIAVGKVDDFKPLSGTIFKFGNKPGILIRRADGEFKAFSAVCTHLDCTVQFDEKIKLIWCACHNGKYDLNGNNVSGPPPKPLTEYQVVLKNKEIFVQKET